MDAQPVLQRLGRPGPWLIGSRFTIADIYLAADLRIAESGKLISTDDQPYAGYFEQFRARPAFVRALEIDERE